MNRVGTTKSVGRKHSLDKFYTKDNIASSCIDKTEVERFTVIVEPSAGGGAFYRQIPDCVGLDVHPECEGVVEQDFFAYYPETTPVSGNPVQGSTKQANLKQGSMEEEPKEEQKILVIGNPPFGQQNSLAIKFFNHAALFADRIAFILPVSFKKESIKGRLNKSFHLVYEETLPVNSFLLNGLDYDVKCVYQIWDRQPTLRSSTVSSKEILNSNNLFIYVKKSENPDAAIQRIGGKAGHATADWVNRSVNSNYFIKFKKSYTPKQLEAVLVKLNKIQYDVRDDTVGPRSISKGELNTAVNWVFKP